MDAHHIRAAIASVIAEKDDALDLRSCGIDEIPRELEECQSLRSLDLSNNRLRHLPALVGQLKNLESLNLEDNQLRDLPRELLDLKPLRRLFLQGNEELQIPSEVLGPRANNVSEGTAPTPAGMILQYYFADEGKRHLNEAKVLFVGDGGVGKTSLVRRLLSDEFSQIQEVTSGIEIRSMTLPLGEDRGVARLNFWDFGGQEILHATHQFFLTERSLYLLVVNARDGQSGNQIEHWLGVIRTYAPNAPTLLVITHSEQRSFEPDLASLTAKFKNLNGTYAVSSATANGIAELREAMAREISRLPHVGEQIPESFYSLRRTLGAMEDDFVSVSRYRQLCMTTGIDSPELQGTYLQFLHDLGEVLHFQGSPALQDTIVLNPTWITDAVYQILNSNALQHTGGVLEIGQLGTILRDDVRHPISMHRFIIEVMSAFELCFELSDTKGRFLIPDLLSATEPDLPWNFEEALQFEYEYEFLPANILGRFICRMHAFLTSPPLLWRQGVVLGMDTALAVVRGNAHARTVRIKVQGPAEKRGSCLATIRVTLESLHELYAGLATSERVLLPDDPELWVELDHIRMLARHGEKSYWPPGAKRSYELQELVTSEYDEQLPSGSPAAPLLVRSRRIDAMLLQASADRDSVRPIAAELKERGLTVWYDEWELVPGQSFRDSLGGAFAQTFAVVVFVGAKASGIWHVEETRQQIQTAIQRGIRVVPVLLSGAERGNLPLFLQTLTYVDLTSGLTTEALDQLVWGITGKKTSPSQMVPTDDREVEALGVHLVDDVFNTVGLPRHTYIEPRIYADVALSVRKKGRHVLVQGSSGSGKTSLVERVLRELHIKDLEDYQWFFGYDEDCGTQVLRLLELAIDGEYNGLIIIDDTHLLKVPDRELIANRLKRLSDKVFQTKDSASCILIGNPITAEGLLFNTSELGARIEVFDIPSATDEELERLVHEGCRLLNLRILGLELLVAEANESFSLCQYLCHFVCRSNHITATADQESEIGFTLPSLRGKTVQKLSYQFRPALLAFCKAGDLSLGRLNPTLVVLKALNATPRQVLQLSEVAARYGEAADHVYSFKDGFGQAIMVAGLSKLLHYDEALEVFSLEDATFRYFLTHMDVPELIEALGVVEHRRFIRSSTDTGIEGSNSNDGRQSALIREESWLPPSGENNVWFADDSNETAIVFLHGIFSDSRGCWLHRGKRGKSDVYWPRLVLADHRIPQVAIFLSGYYTAIDAGPYEVSDCAREVLNALKRTHEKRRPVLDRERIVLVCHSTGGIVARYMLERYVAEFAKKSVGLVLVASPSYGSTYADALDLLARYFRQRLGRQLRWGNWSLRDLDGRFRDLLQRNAIPNLAGVEACENHFILPRWLRWLPPRRVLVTKESAGRYFGDATILRGTDHFGTVKPDSASHPGHELLVDFMSTMPPMS